MGKKNKKSPWLALGIGAAVLGYFLFVKKGSTVTPTDVPPDVSDGSTETPPPPPPPVYNTGLDPTLVTKVLQNQTNTDLQTYYNTIYQLPDDVFTRVQPVAYQLRQKGDIVALKAIADYITNFLTRGVPLTRTADNAALYDEIMSIHATYGIL